MNKYTFRTLAHYGAMYLGEEEVYFGNGGTPARDDTEFYLASEADRRIEALEKAIRDALETLKDYNKDGLDVAIGFLVEDLNEALNGIIPDKA
jgi:hypothetical protein